MNSLLGFWKFLALVGGIGFCFNNVFAIAEMRLESKTEQWKRLIVPIEKAPQVEIASHENETVITVVGQGSSLEFFNGLKSLKLEVCETKCENFFATETEIKDKIDFQYLRLANKLVITLHYELDKEQVLKVNSVFNPPLQELQIDWFRQTIPPVKKVVVALKRKKRAPQSVEVVSKSTVQEKEKVPEIKVPEPKAVYTSALDYPWLAQEKLKDVLDQPLIRLKFDRKKINKMKNLLSLDRAYLRFGGLRIDHNFKKYAKIEIPTPNMNDPEGNDEVSYYNYIKQLISREKLAQARRVLEFYEQKYPKGKLKIAFYYLKAELFEKYWKKYDRIGYLQNAIDQYNFALSKEPSISYADQVLMHIAELYMDSHNYLRSLGIFLQATKQVPNSKFYWHFKIGEAFSLEKSERVTEAVELYRFIENQTDNEQIRVESGFSVGDIYFNEGDYFKAEQNYKSRFIIFNSGLESNHKELNKVVYDLKEFYNKGIFEFPNVLFNMAESQFWQKKYEDSFKNFELFTKIFSNHDHAALANFRMGEINQLLGKGDQEIKKYFLRATQRYPGTMGEKFATIRMLSRNAVASDSVSKVDEYMAKVLAILEQDESDDIESKEFIQFIGGETYFDHGDYEDAIKIWSEFIEKHGNSVYFLPLILNIRRAISAFIEKSTKEKKYHEAIYIFEKHYKQFLQETSYPDIFDKIATCYNQVMSYEQSNKWLLEAQKRYEAINLFQPINNLKIMQANNFISLGQVDSALQILNTLPDQSLADKKNSKYILIARCFEVKKNFKESIDALSFVYKDLTDPTEKFLILFQIGTNYYNLKEYSNAISSLEEAFQIKQDSTDVIKFLGSIYYEVKDYVNSIRVYEFLSTQFKGYQFLPREKYQLAMSYKQNKNINKFEAMLVDMLSLNQTDEESMIWKNLAQKELDDLKFSKKYSRKIESELGKKSL